MSTSPPQTIDGINIEGGRKLRGNLTKARIRFMMLGILVLFSMVGARLVQLGYVKSEAEVFGRERDVITATRPAILDRNGLELAIDIQVPSLYAEPRRIIDVEEAVSKLLIELPYLDEAKLRDRLTGDEGFMWLERELTPQQQERIFQLGIPGVDFKSESRRFYPGGSEVSHVLGTVDIDNHGTAGFELHIDGEDVSLLQELGLARDRALKPVTTSIDLRVQHAMRSQLVDALERYQAIAAAGVLMDVRTGEVLALVSLPDFDPNEPATALAPFGGDKDARINRITNGTFELGSTFKTITFAAALDSGAVTLTDSFDARFGVKFGRYTIDDFHGKHRVLTVPEIYKYSSNVGTIRIMQTLGAKNYRAFIDRMGFDEPLPIELPETARSNIPDEFSEVGAATASFGHGLAVTPLHMVAAVGALVNGGNYVPPTLYPRTNAEARVLYRSVVSPQTSEKMRYLLRLNALEGSGRHANKLAAGYRLGGKTGTAEKIIDGRYNSDKSLTVFASAFPLDQPKYAIVILIDEPKRENEKSGRTAGWNAGEVTGRLVQNVAPMLGVQPNMDDKIDDALVPVVLR